MRLYRLLRGGLWLVSSLLAFVVTSAVAGGWIGSAGGRAAAGGAAMLLAPTLLGIALGRGLRGRALGRRAGLLWTSALANLAVAGVLCAGFSTSAGRALRRRGDWFLASAEGWVPSRLRASIRRGARWLEQLDRDPETERWLQVAAAGRPGAMRAAIGEPPSRPADGPASGPDSPPRSGPADDRPSGPAGVQPPSGSPPVLPARWYHPLAQRGGRRVLPPNASCRFGAPRPGRRPRECQLGHCGVDLPASVGAPVYAIYSGRVVRADRDPGGSAGRYITIAHVDGRLRSSYMHLQRLASGIALGTEVKAGDPIGTVGRSGVHHSGTHLHFALQLRGSHPRYVDPEPLLWTWAPPPGPTLTRTAYR